MKTAGFAGKEVAAAAGAGGAGGPLGTEPSPASPDGAGGTGRATIPAPASTGSASGASSASDSTEDSDSSSDSCSRRLRRAPLRLLIFSGPWASASSAFLPGEPGIRRPRRTCQREGRAAQGGPTHPRVRYMRAPVPSLDVVK